MNKYIKYAITIILLVLAITSLVLFEFVHVEIIKDDKVANMLLSDLLYHLAFAVFLIWLSWVLGNSPFLSIRIKPKHLLWCLPCLLVALVNFPLVGLIKDDINIYRPELIGLFIGYVTSISLLEEIVFRGVILYIFLQLFNNKKLRYFFPILITSLIFALLHGTNIFVGADIGYTLLQILYTFLIGAMLATVMVKTKNIWVCVFIHALFNFGGLMTTSIAIGDPWQEPIFWILTIACGILCAGHIIVSLINLERKHVS